MAKSVSSPKKVDGFPWGKSIWLVTVAGETELLVLADKPGDAAGMVREELTAAIRVRVRLAAPELVEKLKTAKPQDRPKLLRSHSDPRHASRVDREERRLREYIAHRARVAAHIADLVAHAPPIPPEVARGITRILLSPGYPAAEPAGPSATWGTSGIVAAAQLSYDDGGAVSGAAVRAP